jgi:hypothetical protein
MPQNSKLQYGEFGPRLCGISQSQFAPSELRPNADVFHGLVKRLFLIHCGNFINYWGYFKAGDKVYVTLESRKIGNDKLFRIASLQSFILLLAVFAMMPLPAYAYVDPGTGSAVAAFILGLFGAVAYTFRKYMYRMKDFFAGKKSRREADRRADGSDR